MDERQLAFCFFARNFLMMTVVCGMHCNDEEPIILAPDQSNFTDVLSLYHPSGHEDRTLH